MGDTLAALVVKDLPPRPSEFPTARAAGLKQFFYTEKRTTTGLEESDTAEVRCDTDKITEGEYDNIKNDMLQLSSYEGGHRLVVAQLQVHLQTKSVRKRSRA